LEELKAIGFAPIVYRPHDCQLRQIIGKYVICVNYPSLVVCEGDSCVATVIHSANPELSISVMATLLKALGLVREEQPAEVKFVKVSELKGIPKTEPVELIQPEEYRCPSADAETLKELREILEWMKKRVRETSSRKLFGIVFITDKRSGTHYAFPVIRYSAHGSSWLTIRIDADKAFGNIKAISEEEYPSLSRNLSQFDDYIVTVDGRAVKIEGYSISEKERGRYINLKTSDQECKLF